MTDTKSAPKPWVRGAIDTKSAKTHLDGPIDFLIPEDARPGDRCGLGIVECVVDGLKERRR